MESPLKINKGARAPRRFTKPTELLDFSVKRVASQEWVVLPDFETLWSIFFVFHGGVTRHARDTGFFLFGALERDYLTTSIFLFAHDYLGVERVVVISLGCIFS